MPIKKSKVAAPIYKKATQSRAKALSKSAKSAARATKKQIKKATRKPHIVRIKSQKGRSFKQAVSFFKKLGLGFQKTNLRKLKSKPTKSQAKKLQELSTKEIFKLDKKTAAKYRKIGEPVKRNVLVYDRKKGTSRRVKGERIIETQKSKAGRIVREIVPLEFHNLEQWLEDAKKSGELQKKYGNRVGFRYFGNYGIEIHPSVESAVETFQAYKTTQAAIGGSAKDQREVFKNIELIRVEPGMKGINSYAADKRRYEKQYEKHKRKRSNRRTVERLIRMKDRNPGKFSRYVEKKKQENKRYYNKLSADSARMAKRRAQQRRRYKVLHAPKKPT